MYTSALVKLGLNSKSYVATITVLEYYYIHKENDLELKQIKAYTISEDLISKLV
ncbi:MAG TPA: hypothetical protein VJB89_01515 [Candidatus Nanoarchaeia archaeon]|nr:hypothetical protein [Candidatus Nanoarchaeia archaeon]